MEDPWLGLGLGGVLSPDDAAQPAQVEGEHVDGDDEAGVLLHQQLDLHTLQYISFYLSCRTVVDQLPHLGPAGEGDGLVVLLEVRDDAEVVVQRLVAEVVLQLGPEDVVIPAAVCC